MQAGIAKVDITNRGDTKLSDNPLCAQVQGDIPEFYRDMEINIHDPLYVRALVLSDGDRRMAMISLDTTAIACRTITHGILGDSADDFVTRLRQEIYKAYKIPEDHITVCATHTHPPGRLLCGDDEQISRTLQAVGQAVDKMREVTVGVGTECENRLTFNRTAPMRNGFDWTMRGCTPCPPDEDVAGLRPIDPEIGVLRIDDTDGRPVAVVYNFTSHPLLDANNGAITAHFPGVTSRFLEESIGGDVMAMFIQGACGDITEVSKDDVDYPVSIESFGTTLGIGVMKAWSKIETSHGTFNCLSESVDIPLRTDIPDVISALKQEQDKLIASLRYTNLNFKSFLPLYLKYSLHPDYPSHYFYRYRQNTDFGGEDFVRMDIRNKRSIDQYLQSIDAMEQMARNEEKIGTLLKQQAVIEILNHDTVPMEVQGIKIGDLVFITSPAELLCEIGLNLKARSPFKHTFAASFANGYLHYAPPATYYQGGGYEATECLLSPGWEQAFVQTTDDLLSELQHGASSGRPLHAIRAE